MENRIPNSPHIEASSSQLPSCKLSKPAPFSSLDLLLEDLQSNSYPVVPASWRGKLTHPDSVLPSIWTVAESDRALFPVGYFPKRLHSPTHAIPHHHHYSDAAWDFDFNPKLALLLDAATRPSTQLPSLPFFGLANTNSALVVVGGDRKGEGDDDDVHARLKQLMHLANNGYGVVPIMNAFTIAKAKRKPAASPPRNATSPQLFHEIDRIDIALDVSQSLFKKKSQKNLDPPSPSLPKLEEQKTMGGLVCYQVGFSTGRQGLFQGLAIAKSGEHLDQLVNQFVVFAQDDGLEIGIVRGYEYISDLVPHLPEVPYMPVLRRAFAGEVNRLVEKTKDERRVLQFAKDICQANTEFAKSMEIDHCEFQFDRNKLVIYSTMRNWMNFNTFVSQLHAKIDSKLKYQPRIFIQRKFVKAH
ncbi:hypothetical protein BASA81_004882 [Batrachochytrium salamandrivorans]|nr:hypothetical protein BASA81_004882 [Batrachochytrium salamandrivorans]